MNPVLMFGFAIFVLALFTGLFFSMYTLFRLVFNSVQGGLYENLGLASSPPGLVGGDSSSIFLSAIFAALISILIIVLGAIIVIKKGSLVRVVKR